MAKRVNLSNTKLAQYVQDCVKEEFRSIEELLKQFTIMSIQVEEEKSKLKTLDELIVARNITLSEILGKNIHQLLTEVRELTVFYSGIERLFKMNLGRLEKEFSNLKDRSVYK